MLNMNLGYVTNAQYVVCLSDCSGRIKKSWQMTKMHHRDCVLHLVLVNDHGCHWVVGFIKVNASQKCNFYPHKILIEIHRVFCFFCFRMLILTDLIQSPIIFFWQRDLGNPQDWLLIFQGRWPRFSVVSLNEKMCSSPPEAGLLFFMHQKWTVHLFNL